MEGRPDKSGSPNLSTRLTYFKKGTRKLTKKRDTVYMHGKIYWPRVLPNQLHTNYNEDGRQWAFEFEPDDDGIEAIVKTHKLKDRLKDKHKKDGDVRKNYENRDRLFLYLKRNEFDYEGNKNDPIRIVDAANQPWNPRTELGNGTEVDIKLQIVDYGAGKKKGIYPVALRVLDLVPFERSDFTPLPEDDKRVQEAKSKRRSTFEEDFGLEGDPDVDRMDGGSGELEASEIDGPYDELDDDMPA